MLTSLVPIVLSRPPAHAAWYSRGYSYKKSITIDHTKVVGGPLTSFPFLVKEASDASLKTAGNGGSVQNGSGFDMIFADSTETTKLDHEIERYVPTTGEIEMWVRIPTLSAAVDTVIYLYYDNASISTSQENKTSVWDPNYKAVWHMKEDPTSGAPQVGESTTSADHGTVAGSWVAGQQVAGAVAGSLNFIRSSTDQVTAGDLSAEDNSSLLTVETWWNQTTLVNGDEFGGQFLAQGADSSHRYYITAGQVDGCTNCATAVRVEVSNNGAAAHTYGYTPTSTIATGTWYHVVMVFDGTQGTNGNMLKLYLNGSLQTLTFVGAIPTTTANQSQPVTMGFSAGSSTYDNGKIDETRVSNTARSAGWIATEYNNQSSPSTFITVGAVTLSGDATESISAGGYGVLGASPILFPPTTLDGTDQPLGQTATGYIDFNDASGSGLGWSITAQVSSLFTNTARTVADGATNSNTNVTSPSASFVAPDVGRSIAGGSIPAGATIVAVLSGTQITISAAAATTATNVSLTFAFTLPNARISLSSRTPLTCDGGSTCAASGTDPGTITYSKLLPNTPGLPEKIFNVSPGFGMGREGFNNAQTWALGGTLVAGTARAVTYTATITYTMAAGI